MVNRNSIPVTVRVRLGFTFSSQRKPNGFYRQLKHAHEKLREAPVEKLILVFEQLKILSSNRFVVSRGSCS